MWVVPRVGVRTARTLGNANHVRRHPNCTGEWTVRTFPASTRAARVAMGCIALVLMLAAEFGLVLWLRSIRIGHIWQRVTRFRRHHADSIGHLS
jgi:hypothetical protein